MNKNRLVVSVLVSWLLVGLLSAAPQSLIQLSNPVTVATGLPGDISASAVVADIDGDLANDIVLSSAGGGVWWISGATLGTGALNTVVGGGAIYEHAVADLDGDTDMDIVTVSSAGTGWPGSCCGGEVRVHWNDGSGNFSSSQISTAVNGGRGIAIGDLTGDGLPDLVWCWREFGGPSIRFAANLGGGTFGSVTSVGYVPEAHGVLLSDVTGDGVLDVLVAGWYQGTTVLFTNNLSSGGGFTSSNLPGTQGFNRYVRRFDMEGDGEDEILTAYWGGGGGVVWRDNVGGGQFSAPQSILSGVQTIPAAADFDLDGDDDVIIVDGTQLSILESTGASLLPAVALAASTGRAVSAGDLGNDGDDDVIVIRPGGDVVIFENIISSPVQSFATPYGTGCGMPALDFTPTSNPIIGTVAGATIVNAPTLVGGVAMGFDDTFLGGLPILPLSLDSLGMQGCQLLHSNDVFGLPITGGAPGTLDFSRGIPGNANLLGVHVYLQAYCYAPGANALEVIASNGIDWALGNQ